VVKERMDKTMKSDVEMAKQSSSSGDAVKEAATAEKQLQVAPHSSASTSSSTSPCPVASVLSHSRPNDRLFTSEAGKTRLHTPPAGSDSAASSSSSSYAATSNCVVSSKYTLLSFLPLNLFEQFHNVANLYFLLVGVLQAIPPLSTTAGIPTMYEPLAFIVFISCLRAAKEDYDRHQADSKRNGRLLDVLTEAGWQQRRSGDLRVGDVIRIRDGEMIPADCLFLSSSHAKGHCYLDKGQGRQLLSTAPHLLPLAPSAHSPLLVVLCAASEPQRRDAAGGAEQSVHHASSLRCCR
jgi:magnesium-transporting ATPase (P-type)